MTQPQPLTETQERYNATHRALTRAERLVSEKSAGLFTARELIDFGIFAKRQFVLLPQETLDKQLEEMTALLSELEKRETV